jgi:hypothetical protein
MSAEFCTICGVYGTSTKKCCGNNKEYRIKELYEMIGENKSMILGLEFENLEMLHELEKLENE